MSPFRTTVIILFITVISFGWLTIRTQALTATLYPDGTITRDWATVSGCTATSRWDCVNETSNSTVDYISTGTGSTSNEVEEFTMTSAANNNVAVTQFVVTIYANSVACNGNAPNCDQLSVNIRIGGTLQTAQVFTMTTTNAAYTATFSGSWANDKDLQVLVTRTRVGGGSGANADDDVQLTSVKADVTYTNTAAFEQAAYRWFGNQDSIESAFDSDGVYTNDVTTANDAIYTSTRDDTWLYVAGYDGNGGIDWRVQKHKLADGSLDPNFGTGGVVQSAPSTGDDRIESILVDDNYIYIIGWQTISSGNNEWRIEKRNKSTGNLCSSVANCAEGIFDGDGVIVTSLFPLDDRPYAGSLDGDYLYIAGTYATGSGNSDWGIEKRNKITGALCSSASNCAEGAFDSDGALYLQFSSSYDQIYNVVATGDYMYLMGYDSVISSTDAQIRLEKRNKITGALCSSVANCAEGIFDGDGVFLYNPTTVDTDEIPGDDTLNIDGDYIYFNYHVASTFNMELMKVNRITGLLCSSMANCAEGIFDNDGTLTVNLGEVPALFHGLRIGHDSLFIAGLDKSVDGGFSQWNIRKYDKFNGTIVSQFGTNGVVLSNPSTNHDEVRDLEIDPASNAMWVSGYDFSSGNAQWRIEKRTLDDGVLLSTANMAPVDVGAAMAAQDTAITAPAEGVPFRLRMNLHVSIGNVTDGDFKLQYAARGSDNVCDTSFTGETYVDIEEKLSSWTEETSAAPWSNRGNHTSVVFNDKMWLMGGSDGSRKNDVWSSSDGINWTQETAAAAWSARFSHSSVVFDNKMWVIGGYVEQGGQSVEQNDVWSSSDGINWTQETAAAAWSARANHSSVVYDNKMWVIGGHDGAATNDVWYSPDGITWTQATSAAAWPARMNHVSVIFNNKMWVIGGNSNTDAWSSSDGINWTRTSTSVNNKASKFGAVYNNRIWLMGGADSDDNYYNDIQYSSDGKAWNQATNPGWSGRISATTVAFSNRLWVIGGSDASVWSAGWVIPKINYYNNTNAVDGMGIDSSTDDPVHSGHTNVRQTYEESNDFGVANAIADGSDGMWDFALVTNGAAAGTTYCLRAVTSGGTVLSTYAVIPQISTPSPQFEQSAYRWFENSDTSTDPSLAKLADPATMPGNTVYTTAWSPDGQYLSVGSNTNTADRFTIYKRSGDTFTKLANPATMPGSYVYSTAWSPDGQYLSVGSYTTTDRLTIYKRSEDTFTKLSDPAVLPGVNVRTTAWSPDGQYLSVGSYTSTADRFTIYKRSGDSFTKLADPAAMPGANVYTTAWSPDGQYLSVGSFTSTADRFTIYKRSGDSFTKLPDPATMPGSNVRSTAWSPDGQYLSVGSSTTTADRFTIYKRSGDSFTKLPDPATMPGTTVLTTAWSPDGQYLSVGSDTTTADRFTIYKVSSTQANIGLPMAALDTAITAPAEGTPFRLRMNLHVSLASVSSWDFKLQYAQRGADNVCDTSFTNETYADVTTSTPIAYYDNTNLADGQGMATNANDPTHLGHPLAWQTYQEANNFSLNNAIADGADGMWDFALVDSSAPGGTSYCFRAVNSDGSVLSSYSTIPEVSTAGVVNSAPSAPTLSAPSDAATSISITPTFQLRSSDANNDYLRYRIEVCSTSNCSAIVRTIDQTASQTGWSAQDAETGTAYVGSSTLTSSTLANHAFQNPVLNNSTQYWWRAYAIDPGGSNTWSSASSISSFTTGVPTSDATTINGGVEIRGGTTIGQ